MFRAHSVFAASILVLTLTGAAVAGGKGPVGETYVLNEGSTITDECVFCDRAPITKALTGSFVLTQIPSLVCCVYSVTELSLRDLDGEFAVKGEGIYSINTIGKESQQISLDLNVNGTDGVHLESGPVDITVKFPNIEIVATEEGTRDPSHKYTLRISASLGSPAESTNYKLVEGNDGSVLNRICPVCRLANPTVPLAGSFRLTRINDEADPVGRYEIDSLQFHSTLPTVEYLITGGGTYSQGGEDAPAHEMSLTLRVNEEDGLSFESGLVKLQDGIVFPKITIDVTQQNVVGAITYSIHLVAVPGNTTTATSFKRGDSNGDGKLDISDAVHILNWRFSGGAQPDCLDAADTNADSLEDLTDAVFLLVYLFQGGRAPPFPGPDVCGAPDPLVFGCESYPPCSQ